MGRWWRAAVGVRLRLVGSPQPTKLKSRHHRHRGRPRDLVAGDHRLAVGIVPTISQSISAFGYWNGLPKYMSSQTAD